MTLIKSRENTQRLSTPQPFIPKIAQQLNPASSQQQQRESINPFDFVLGLYMGDTRFRALTNGEPENTQRLLRILASISPQDLKNPLEERMREERHELMKILESSSQKASSSMQEQQPEAGVEAEHLENATASSSGLYDSEPKVLHRTLPNGKAYPYSEGMGARKTARAYVALSPAGSLGMSTRVSP